MSETEPLGGIAIIGMAGRFPDAPTVAAFWQNLVDGVESITRFAPDELDDAFDARTRALPNFVAAKPILDGVDLFDAAFFGMLPREAALTDPQQRILLECGWEALETAGYDPGAPGSCIGVFAGATSSTYLLQHLLGDRAAISAYTSGFQTGNLPELMGSAADFTATRIGYKLGLTGPCVAVQSACSTSLLAVAQAVQSLRAHSCDMALAGGVSITFPQRRGYLAQEGGMVSTDGHCRPFGAQANGTVFGHGAGLVVLKRLEDALADRDTVHAVIRGVGLNNDGASKVGFAAPSIEGQAAAIAMAHADAGVTADTIGYVEAHGTGTPTGDPIELAGLSMAFRATTPECGFCRLGSAKSNIGHLDAAAGVTGLIKAALTVSTGIVPASLHAGSPNPALALDESPFVLAAERVAFPDRGIRRRAGVSAFGVGGTNVHLVLEQAPDVVAEPSARRSQILPLSTRSATALTALRRRLADHIEARPDLDLADIAFTLQTGRKSFPHRCAVAGSDRDELAASLRKETPARHVGGETGDLVFMFPGQGAQFPQMGRELYAGEGVFRETVDDCAEILKPELGFDLREALYPSNGHGEAQRLSETALAQPAIFTIEYALATLLRSWALEPSALIGHSVGEFAAACLAGVMTLEDALRLVATRGRLMQALPRGAMVAVRASEGDIAGLGVPDISLAAANAPGMTVLAGPFAAIEAAEAELGRRGLPHRRLQTSHAFHSAMVEPLVAPFADAVAGVELRAPQCPYVSTVTGDWITPGQATSPDYWARHAREPVRFADALATLMRHGDPVLLETGPGGALSGFALQGAASGKPAIPCLGGEGSDAEATLATALGRLWTHGVAPDWNAYHAAAARRRVPLPTYPFERSRHWVEAPEALRETARPPAIPAPPVQDNTMSPAASSPATSELSARVATLFETLSGRSFDAGDKAASFLELGFDSLLLTQAAQAVQTTFGVPIRFRQLLDEFGSIDDLTRHIAAVNPPAPAPAPSPAIAAAAASVPARAPEPEGASAPPLEGLMRQQLEAMSRLMEQQLQALSGRALPDIAVIAAEAPAAPAAEPAPPAPSASRVKALIRKTAEPLNAAQRAHIAALAQRLSRRMPDSKRLADAHRPVLADPRTVAGFSPDWKELVFPVVAARAKGATIWDIDGNAYIDLVNGYGQTCFGHAPDFVVAAVKAQLEDGFAIGPQTPLAHEAAALFCKLTGHQRVAFCNTGSEAVMAALRVARTVTGRDRIVSFTGAYHGQFDEVLARGLGEDETRRSLPAAPGIPAEAVGRLTVLDYGSDASLAWIRRHADELAAVLVEPVQSRKPGHLPVEFLKELRRLTQASGTALVFDEVVTGFRVHPAGVQALIGIAPDLATYGKVVGGGLPIGLLAGTPRFMDALDGGAWRFGDDSVPETGVTFFAGTFVRHPLALAATLAVLRHVEAEGPKLQQGLTARMDDFARRLRSAFAEVGWDVPIEHYGSLLYCEPARDHRLGSLLFHHLREHGVFVQEHYPIFLTTEHGEAEIATIVQAFRDSLRAMREDGLLPRPVGIAIDPPSAPAQETGPRMIPLTASQLEIWLSAQTGPEASAAFNESVDVTLDGAVDAEALRSAVKAIAARHPILSATFAEDGSTMRFGAAPPLPVVCVDLRQDSDPEAALRRRQATRAATPFDLVAGPVAEAEIVRLSEERHVLTVSAHHIVCDGWSINLLTEEIAAAYRGAADALPAPRDYAGYAASLRDDPRAGDAKAYWLKQFLTVPEPLELPLNHPRAAQRSFAGGSLTSLIDAGLYGGLKALAAQRRKTLFAVLFSSFQILLHRLSGQRDLVIGVPAAGQSLIDRPPIGHFVNFLPIRGDIHPERSFAEHLAATATIVLDAYDHQSCTLGSLLEALHLPPVQGRLPLTEVQFNLERLPEGSDFGAEITAAIAPNPKAFSTFDLYLNIGESAEGLRLDCTYAAGLYDEPTIARWLAHYRAVLEAVVANPDAVIAEIQLGDRPAAEAAHDLATDAAMDLVGLPDVVAMFREQVRANPEALAVSLDEQSLSYRALDAWSDLIAAEIAARVAEPEGRVGLLIERSPALLAGLIGALKAGRPYVPLDPIMPPARMRGFLQDAGACALLTDGSPTADLLDGFDGLGAIAVIDVHDTDPKLATLTSLAPDPGHLAYVIYTSGSTGRPKGVEVTRGGLANLLAAMAEQPGFGRADALLAVTTVSFDIAALELLLPLTQGGRVSLATSEEARDGEALLAKLQRCGATMIQATPMSWRMLLDAGFRSWPGFRMLCGGEALPRELALRLMEGGGDLWNMFGPTETTIWSSLDRVDPADETITIGRPIARTGFRIVDPEGRPVPVGVPGELWITGAGLARGYAGQPELTARSFVPDTVGPGRAYRTGDRARFLPDGRVQHLGRLDHQIKLRGFRIEPGEIEAVLMRRCGLTGAVILREDVPGEQRLVCYHVARPGDDAPGPQDLRRILAEELPDYMVPAVFVALPALPLNASGKLDRAALPMPEARPSAPSPEIAAPRSATETVLAKIWCEVLKRDHVGVEDDLFDLGADSLAIFQITGRARRDGLKLTARDLFRNRTIAGVAIAIDTAGGEAAPAPTVPPAWTLPWRRGQAGAARHEQG